MTNCTITVEEDPDTKELVIPFSEEMLKEVGWTVDRRAV